MMKTTTHKCGLTYRLSDYKRCPKCWRQLEVKRALMAMRTPRKVDCYV